MSVICTRRIRKREKTFDNPFCVFQACVRFHTCCMLTCTVNDGVDTLPRDKTELTRAGHVCREDNTRAPLLPLSTPALPPQPPTRLFGMRASDIDKYSRVIFPIMFITFHLMYWMVYLSLAGEPVDDIVYLNNPHK